MEFFFLRLESEKPNNVLILTVYNAQYPITVVRRRGLIFFRTLQLSVKNFQDIINSICKAHGDVYRIALIRRNLLQALVEFDSVESARKAKYALNGADIYSGCCTLKVEFAKVNKSRFSAEQSAYNSAAPSRVLYEHVWLLTMMTIH